tara:strand:+ start:62 stop:271 length:210 start_codon:yes stop_codon:yes gene_type:complete
MMKMTMEEYQVIYSALGCVRLDLTCGITTTLVDCAKQILDMHMSDEVEVDLDFNNGPLQIISAKGSGAK